MNECVRKLGPGETTTARALIRSFHSRNVLEAHLQRLLSDPANVLLVAELGAQVIGFAYAHWLDRLARERRHLFLYEIEVDPHHRRKGIGRELLNSVLAEARAKQADVFVFTNHSNAVAVSFYESLGGVAENGDDLLFVYPYDGAT